MPKWFACFLPARKQKRNKKQKQGGNAVVEMDSGLHNNDTPVVVMGQSGNDIFATPLVDKRNAREESSEVICGAESVSIPSVVHKEIEKVDLFGTCVEEHNIREESGEVEAVSIPLVVSKELDKHVVLCPPSQSNKNHPVVSTVNGSPQSTDDEVEDSHTEDVQRGGHYMLLHGFKNAVSSNTVDDSVEIPNGNLVNLNDYVIPADSVCGKVKYCYTAKEVGQLTINVCDTITRIKKVDDSWSEGELKGKYGTFPTDYVTIEIADSAQEIKVNGLDENDGPSKILPPITATQETGNTTDDLLPGSPCHEPCPTLTATQETGSVTDDLMPGPEHQPLTNGIANTLCQDVSNSTDSHADTHQNLSIVTNQGRSKTCTSHAIGKALSALFDMMDSEKIACCLNQLFKDLNGTYPEEYNNCTIQVTQANDEAGFILVFVRECKSEDIYKNYQYVLTYEQEPGKYHCIYMKEKKENSFLCINSWGDLNQPEVKVPIEKVRKIYKIGGRWKNQKSLLEPTIKMLTFGQRKDIAEKLDYLCHNNYYDLGMKLCEEYANESKLQKEEIPSLHLNYCGGGSPALQFLLSLQTKKPSYKLCSFIEIAKNFSRIDIVNIMFEWSKNKKLLSDVKGDELKTLARLLDKENAMRDWRDFADKLNFSNHEIKVIEESVKAGKKNSPAQELLELISTKNPNFELIHLRKALEDIARNDVVEVLTPIIDFCKNEMIKSSNVPTGFR